MKKRIELESVPAEYRAEELGSGHNGTCYITKEGKVFKEYHTEGIDDKITEDLVGLQYDGFTFPEQLISIDGILKGYLKEYVIGQTLDKLDHSKVNVVDFNNAIREFETQLMDFSYDTELDVYDLNLHNLVYTEDGKIVDIDTDPMHPFTYPITNPYYENLKELSASLEDIFMKGEFKSQRLQQLQKECIVGGCMRPSTFISEAIEKMDKFIDVTTIEDYKKGLSLLRK